MDDDVVIRCDNAFCSLGCDGTSVSVFKINSSVAINLVNAMGLLCLE